MPRQYWLTVKEEKKIYDLHENDPQDPRYRKFLTRLTEPLRQRLPENQEGLDFGCGPGPTLSQILKESGHNVDLYDPIYYNDRSKLAKQYDFICATEVVEHLREPNETFTTLFSLLRPGTTLAIMTKLVLDKERFKNWHYIRDPTHICFYHRNTFAYVAEQFQSSCEFVSDDVIIMQAPE